MWWSKPTTCSKCEELERKLSALHEDFVILQDKVFHWMKRSQARERREGDGPEPPVEAKDGVPPRIARLLERRARGPAPRT